MDMLTMLDVRNKLKSKANGRSWEKYPGDYFVDMEYQAVDK